MRRSVIALLLSGLVLVAAPRAPADASLAVERAQRRLNQLGCESGPADGRMDEHVRSAVIRFQSRHRLSPTGNLNGPTTGRLYADDAHRCDVRPVPPGSGSGRRIVISQRQNWVWLVAAGSFVFAASLYALALGAPRWSAAFAPIGGTAMMGGWAWLVVVALRPRTNAR